MKNLHTILLNTSFHKSTNKGSIQEKKAFNLNDIKNWINHNHRNFKNEMILDQYSNSLIDKSLSKNNNVVSTNLKYNEWINSLIPQSVIDAYNKNKKPSRRIKDYFLFLTKNQTSTKQSIAEQLIFSLGSKEDYKNLNDLLKDDTDWIKMWKQYQKELTQNLNVIIPEFKIFDNALHLDETTPHIHIIGVGVIDTNKKTGLKTRIASSELFTMQKLKEMHTKIRSFNQNFVKHINQLVRVKNIKFDPDLKELVFDKNQKENLMDLNFVANQENIQDRIQKRNRFENKDVSHLISQMMKKEVSDADKEKLLGFLLRDFNPKYKEYEDKILNLQEENQMKIEMFYKFLKRLKGLDDITRFDILKVFIVDTTKDKNEVIKIFKNNPKYKFGISLQPTNKEEY